MNTILIKIILDDLAFLELSSDEIIDPDAAVKQMESIASSLQSMDRNEIEEFKQLTREIAAKSKDLEMKEFLTSICSDLGL